MKDFFYYVKLTLEIAKFNVLSEMEYRASFFIQTIGMFVNDIGLILVWVIFFSKFSSVNGWTLSNTVILFAIGTVNLGLTRLFAGGAEEIADMIVKGKLDMYLTLPKNVLWQLSTSTLKVWSLGDVAFGICLFAVFGHPTLSRTLWFIGISAFTPLIWFNFMVIMNSLAFFFDRFDETIDRVVWATLSISLYPESAFTGLFRIMTFSIIPVFAIVWLPVRILNNPNWNLVFILLGFWFVTFILAMLLFNKGLKRYESGNLIQTRI